MSTIFIRNPRLLALACGFIIIVGVLAFVRLPRMEDPLLTPRIATITTLYPGADAERVESLVTEKIEEELKSIQEIKDLRSTSRAGVSFISIRLRDETTERVAQSVWSRARDKVEDARLLMPRDVLKPDFEQLDVKAFALILALRWDAENEPSYAILRRLLKQLKDRIDAVPGTEKSEIYGAPNEEILVTLRPEVTASMDLTADKVSELIRASDAKVSAGLLRTSTKDILLEVSGELDSLVGVGKIPIQLGGAGSVVELSDVAEIQRTIQTPVSSKVLLQDRPAVALGILVRSEVRLDLWNNRIQPVLAEFEAELPPGIAFEKVFEQSYYVSNRMNTLFANLITGAVAVFFVVLIFMGWRSAIIVSCALPLSSLMVLASMQFLDIPIHQMSITGLIIALGLLIDNAIVIVDEVAHKLRQGHSRLEAVREGTNYLLLPLLGSTLTTAFSFGPIALMPGPSGEFVGSIAIVTILAVTSSFLLAITIVPAIAGLGLKREKSKSWADSGVGFAPLTKIYTKLIRFLVAKPVLGLAVTIVLPLLGFSVFPLLPEQFFPPADRSQFQIELETPATGSLAETELLARQIREELLKDPSIENISWFLGESAPVFYYNLVPNRKNAARYGQAMVNCKEGTDTRALIRSLQDKLDRMFPQASCLVRQLEQGPPFVAPIEIRIFGPDAERLLELGEQVRLVMTQTPHVINTRSELSEALPKVMFEVDEEQARLAGLDNSMIAAELNSALEGVTGGSILEGTEELPVRVRVSSDRRADLNQISAIDMLPRNDGQKNGTEYRGVPLGAISSLRLDSELGGVSRFNGQRMNEVQAFVKAGVLPSLVLADFEERLAASGFELPAGYSRTYGGAKSERNDAVGSLISNTVMLFSLMVVTLVLSTGSFRMAGLLFAVAGLSVGFGFGSLWLAGYAWGFTSIVGMMGMIGVAVNDSIVVLTALNTIPAELRRSPQAICDTVVTNTRHVLTTTLTTVVGFFPLVLGGGEFWPPVAISISGGVVGATLLSLVLVPCAFILLQKRGKHPSPDTTETHEEPT